MYIWLRMGSFRFAPVLLLPIALGACQSVEEMAAQKTGGDPKRGRQVLRKYGCDSCHTIPGVSASDGLVGPPLDRIGSRDYLAGQLENTPENLMRWIRDPQGISAGTAMPNLGVTETLWIVFILCGTPSNSAGHRKMTARHR